MKNLAIKLTVASMLLSTAALAQGPLTTVYQPVSCEETRLPTAAKGVNPPLNPIMKACETFRSYPVETYQLLFLSDDFQNGKIWPYMTWDKHPEGGFWLGWLMEGAPISGGHVSMDTPDMSFKFSIDKDGATDTTINKREGTKMVIKYKAVRSR